MLGALVFLPGCILDFDDVDGLPCPCDPEYTCLLGSSKCVLRGSVELFKSCSTDTPNNGDDLCPPNAVCESINGNGPRCLPLCTPTNYGTPASGQKVADQCPFGNTCWIARSSGVCSEGVCNDNPNNCDAGQQCVRFNGAGVCFTTCGVFQTNPLPCSAGQLCQPIGESSVTACIPSGPVQRTQECNEENMCAKTDENGRPMVCDVALGSTDTLRRCFAICDPAEGAARCNPNLNEFNCPTSRPNVEPRSGRSLGICTPTQ